MILHYLFLSNIPVLASQLSTCDNLRITAICFPGTPECHQTGCYSSWLQDSDAHSLQPSNFQTRISGANVSWTEITWWQMKYEWQRSLYGKVSSRILPPPDHIKLTTRAFLMTASQHGIHGGCHENSTEEASIQLTFLCKQTWSVDQNG